MVDILSSVKNKQPFRGRFVAAADGYGVLSSNIIRSSVCVRAISLVDAARQVGVFFLGNNRGIMGKVVLGSGCQGVGKPVV